MSDLSTLSQRILPPSPAASSAGIGFYSGTSSGSVAQLFPAWSAGGKTYLRGEIVLVGTADAGVLYICIGKSGTGTSSGGAPGTQTVVTTNVRYGAASIWTTTDLCSWSNAAVIGNGMAITNTGSAVLSLGLDSNLAANSTARIDIAAGASAVLNPAIPPAWWYIIGSSTYSVVVQA